MELLEAVVAGRVAEAQFLEEFSRLFRGNSPVSAAESQCLTEFVEDVNMAEHGGQLLDKRFVAKADECLRRLAAGNSASEIKSFFRANRM